MSDTSQQAGDLGASEARAKRRRAPEQRPGIFWTLLGTSAYKEVEYSRHDNEPGSVQPVRSRYIQVARLKALRERGVALRKAYVCLTEKAETSNWLQASVDTRNQTAPPQAAASTEPGLRDCLREEQLEATPVTVPDCKNGDEYWDLFSQIVEQVEQAARRTAAPHPAEARERDAPPRLRCVCAAFRSLRAARSPMT